MIYKTEPGSLFDRSLEDRLRLLLLHTLLQWWYLKQQPLSPVCLDQIL